ALIEALGETEAVLIGHDWGASTVYEAATLSPEHVVKLVAL
ncbi:MAG: alpha/beta hydrolase, partial [Rhodobiaceae bacterium]|nr:alpha/beta hydrolase [Rhodobiaceae bacterium]